MAVSHPGFKSYYVRVRFDEGYGFKFKPHHLKVPANTLATITWFTDDPRITFTRLVWCDNNDHCSQQPLYRGSYMVGAAQTRDIRNDVYWKYQVKADLTIGGRTQHIESTACNVGTDGLPAIHPR